MSETVAVIKGEVALGEADGVFDYGQLPFPYIPTAGDVVTGLSSERQIDQFELYLAGLVDGQLSTERWESQIGREPLTDSLRLWTLPGQTSTRTFIGGLVGGQALILPRPKGTAKSSISMALSVGHNSTGKGTVRTVTRGVTYKPRNYRVEGEYVGRVTHNAKWLRQQEAFIDHLERANKPNPRFLAVQGMRRAILAGLPELVGTNRSVY